MGVCVSYLVRLPADKQTKNKHRFSSRYRLTSVCFNSACMSISAHSLLAVKNDRLVGSLAIQSSPTSMTAIRSLSLSLSLSLSPSLNHSLSLSRSLSRYLSRYVFVCVCVCGFGYMRPCIDARVHVGVRMFTCVCVRVYVCVCLESCEISQIYVDICATDVRSKNSKEYSIYS